MYAGLLLMRDHFAHIHQTVLCDLLRGKEVYLLKRKTLRHV